MFLNVSTNSNGYNLSNSYLAERVVVAMYRRWEADVTYFGDRARCVQDVMEHLAQLDVALQTTSPTIFTDYVKWLRGWFNGQGFSRLTVWETLNCLRDVLLEELPTEKGAMAHAYISEAMKQLQIQTTGHLLDLASRSMTDIAQQYLALVLGGDQSQATQLIFEAVETGTPVTDIFLRVFQPSQYEIGLLWQTRKINVAQEHYATAITQTLMSQLQPYLLKAPPNGRCVVATSVSGEQHDMGIRMVASFFETAGWRTYYLGANTPTHCLIQILVEQKVDLLAISATFAPHLRATQELIGHARGAVSGLSILVGGYPFNRAPDLWRRLGADGYAPDARQAVVEATRLMEGGAAASTVNGAAVPQLLEVCPS
jgi:MerR family transcriptional regulator, light-induced transcriptional regulator